MITPDYLNDCIVELIRLPSEKTVTIEVNFGEVELVPGVNLGRLLVVVAEEGVILSGRLELYKDSLVLNEPSLSVSPESLVAPE